MVQLEEEDDDEKREAIEEFLKEVTESPLETIVDDIFAQWSKVGVSGAVASL